jgi:hypothetical protein
MRAYVRCQGYFANRIGIDRTKAARASAAINSTIDDCVRVKVAISGRH